MLNTIFEFEEKAMSQEVYKADAENYKFEIREFKKTQEDAQMLAECYNTFDDPESWPGGFSHAEPFTAERILEGLEKESYISKMVAVADGKIVGHCNVLEHFYEEDTVYVGLLGVDPKYQGRKIGKNFLLKATDKAVELGKNEITLHTWGGNLKAVPLYKKTGYYWAPESSVYMENFLPGILGNKLFKSYFDKFDWYTTYKRDLSLTPDAQKIGSMDIYEYKFEADENNSLQVIIDQRAKKICGFELKNPEGIIGVKCLVKESIAHPGFGKNSVEWIFTNKTSKMIDFTLLIELKDGLSFSEKPEISHKLEPGETKTVVAFVLLDENNATKSNPKEVHERTKERVESTILFNEHSFDLAIGFVPVDPLEIEVFPKIRSFVLGEETNLTLRLWNRTSSKLKGFIIPEQNKDLISKTVKIPFILESNSRINFDIPITINTEIIKNFIELILNIFIETKEGIVKLPLEKLPLPVTRPLSSDSDLFSFVKENKYAMIENSKLRLVFDLKPSFSLKYIENKQNENHRYVLGIGHLDIGPPLQGWVSELTREKQEMEIKQERNKLTIIFSIISNRKEKMVIKREFSVYSNTELFEYSITVINGSNNKHKEILLRTYSDEYDWNFVEGTLYLPLKNGLLESKDDSNFNASRHFPKEKDKWSESWYCIQFEDNKIFGALWGTNYLNKIEIQPNVSPSFEYSLGDFESGESKKITNYFFLGSGNYKNVRKFWKDLIRRESSINYEHKEEELKLLKPIELSTSSLVFGSQNSFQIQPINYNDTIKIKVINNTKRKFEGKFTLQLPKGITFEDGTHLVEEQVSEFSNDIAIEKNIKVIAQDIAQGKIFSIDCRFVIEGTEFKLPFLVQVLDKDAKISIEKKTHENGKEFYEISNGKICYAASKDMMGSTFALKIPSLIEENNLQSSWPEIKTFLWDSHWVGGICPYISTIYGWGALTHLEKFNSEIISQGIEKGVRFSSTLQSKDFYKGLKLEIDYITLPKSNALKVIFRLLNETDATLKFRGGLQAMPAVGGKVTNDFYIEYNGEQIKRTFQNRVWFNKKTNRWAVFTDEETKIGLAVLGPNISNIFLRVNDEGELSNSINTITFLTIPPKDKIEYEMLYILYPFNHDMLELLRRIEVSF